MVIVGVLLSSQCSQWFSIISNTKSCVKTQHPLESIAQKPSKWPWKPMEAPFQEGLSGIVHLHGVVFLHWLQDLPWGNPWPEDNSEPLTFASLDFYSFQKGWTLQTLLEYHETMKRCSKVVKRHVYGVEVLAKWNTKTLWRLRFTQPGHRDFGKTVHYWGVTSETICYPFYSCMKPPYYHNGQPMCDWCIHKLGVIETLCVPACTRQNIVGGHIVYVYICLFTVFYMWNATGYWEIDKNARWETEKYAW